MRHASFISGVALVAATVLTGCLGEEPIGSDHLNGDARTTRDLAWVW
jgi:hypothetical protein